MATIPKPSMNAIWAESGTKTAPSTDKIKTGWVVEIPPHEYMNYIQNRMDQMLAHINQAGIAVWDSATEYQAGRSYVQGSSGTVYRAITTNTNINPETDRNNNWSKPFDLTPPAVIGEPAPTLDALIRTNNLSDVPDKEAARLNLGITLSGANTGAGNGLVASGESIALGTPSHITPTSGNTVGTSTHTHAIDMQSFFPRSVGTNGKVMLPGGLTLLWGTTSQSYSEGAHEIAFHEAFTTTCLNVQVNGLVELEGHDKEWVVNLRNWTRNGFRISCGFPHANRNSAQIVYFAIGY